MRIWLILFLFIFSCIFVAKAYAQDVSLGTAIMVEFTDKNAQDGDIVSSKAGGGYVRSTLSYDPFLFGVISLKPAIYLYDKNFQNGVPIISVGKAFVRVSTLEGEIIKGDRITSSKNPGVGVKAVQNGYIVGTAEEDYREKDPAKVGKILVAVDPRFAQINSNLAVTLFTFPRLSFTEALQSPSTALRYFLAALITASTLFLGVRFFSRLTTKGLEALGRNPLAKRSIMIGIVVNAVLILGIMLFGLAVAYLILAF